MRQGKLGTPNPKVEFPKMHWQTARQEVSAMNESAILEYMQTWRDLNPYHRFELLTDASASTFVENEFVNQPEIVKTYLELGDGILRSDMVRYLTVLAQGGVYSDTDTRAIKPIAEWIPHEFKDKVNVVVGLEIDAPDVPEEDWAFPEWPSNFQICQSTFMAKPGHRVMQMVVDRVVARLQDEARVQHTSISDMTLDYQDVLNATGPRLFTDVLLDYFALLPKPVMRDELVGLIEPRLVGDVLALPVVYFVPGQSHSNSSTPDDPRALVEHMFRGSWKEVHKPQWRIQQIAEEEAAAEQQRLEEEANLQS